METYEELRRSMISLRGFSLIRRSGVVRGSASSGDGCSDRKYFSLENLSCQPKRFLQPILRRDDLAPDKLLPRTLHGSATIARPERSRRFKSAVPGLLPLGSRRHFPRSVRLVSCKSTAKSIQRITLSSTVTSSGRQQNTRIIVKFPWHTLIASASKRRDVFERETVYGTYTRTGDSAWILYDNL